MSSDDNTNKQSPKPTATRKPSDEVEMSRPTFLSAQIHGTGSRPLARPQSLAGPSLKPPPAASRPASLASRPAPLGVISKEDYMRGPGHNRDASSASAYDDDDLADLKSNWIPKTLRVVPAFYPLEKSSRLVEDSPYDIACRLSDCFRKLSIQAIYNNDTASLYTSEGVEMHLSLWKTNPQSMQPAVVVELQRRKGDSIAFHRYSRSILDAAVGDDLDPQAMDDIVYSKKVQRLLAMEQNHDLQEHENAVIAIEIAHGLLMKDRIDARRLGLESLCLLTDPRKTGYVTAVLCSHVVLLGTTSGVEIPGIDKSAGDVVMDESPFQEICEAILGLVQFSRLKEDEDDEVANDPDSEHMMVLHNLALAVLANALDVIEHPERFEDDDDDDEPEDSKPRARLRTASSTDVANEFLQQSKEFSRTEMLSTLISELGKAEHKPHDATLSAKCLASLLRASDQAKRRAKDLGAKTVVSTALDVGTRTHLKLETECKKVVKALQEPPRTENDA